MLKPTSPGAALLIGGAALTAATGIAYQPWVDLRRFESDIAWNGFGHFQGAAPYDVIGDLPLVNSLGWVILVAIALAGVTLVAAAARGVPRLRFVGLAAALVALATAVACLLRPDVLAAPALREFGIEPIGARSIVDATWLWSEVAVTAVFTLAVAGIIVAARRTPPAA